MVVVIGLVSIVALALTVWNARRQSAQMRVRLRAVEAAEAEVRRLLDELPEAVLLIDTDHVVHSTNAAALALFDLGAPDLVDGDLLEHTDGDDQIQLAAAIQRAVEGDDVEPLQIEVIGGATRRVVVEASFHMPRRAWREDDQRIVVRLRDVSEREQQSRALDQARRRFQQAFQSAPTGMALVRVDDGRIVDANQSLAEMLYCCG
jgi:PAS domain-containing protein